MAQSLIEVAGVLGGAPEPSPTNRPVLLGLEKTSGTFSRWTIVSIGIHVAVIAVIGAGSVTDNTQPRPAIRVTILEGRNGGEAGGGSAPVVVQPPAPPPAIEVAPVPKAAVKPARKAQPRGKAVKRKAIAPPPLAQPKASDAAVESDSKLSAKGDVVASLRPGSGHGSGRGTGGGGDGTGVGGTQFSAYLGLVREAIDRAKRYPPMARRREIEGRVSLLIEITRGGQARAVELRHADHPLLGEAALHAVELASPFPPFPEEIQAETLRIEIPVRFALNAR